MKRFLFAILSLVASSTFASQAPAKCSQGCQVPPKCEAMANFTGTRLFPELGNTLQVQVWSVEVVTENPHPGNYQIEIYDVMLSGKPLHSLIFVSGYQDERSPNGECRVDLVDGAPPVGSS